MKKLRICHLYPDLMDTYGDKGNITALVRRCKWRGIDSQVMNVSIGDKFPDADIYFFGGGQDRQQVIVGEDLQKKGKQLKETIDRGKVLLSICGGYQLLQKYFKTKEGDVIEGIGLFDAYTVGSDERMTQNLLIKINPELQKEISRSYSLPLQGGRSASVTMTDEMELVGFENHSGKTYLGSEVQPLGTVIAGAGNNGEDKTEGAVYKNAFGCYLHGSLLPKNPHFADFLIAKSLGVKLPALDDSFEWEAHKQAIRVISG